MDSHTNGRFRVKPIFTNKIVSATLMYEEKSLVCAEKGCGRTFVWTVGEQKFMAQLLEEGKIDFLAEPKRCPKCRAKRKQQRESRA
jgi:hypothetical protein